MDNMAGIFRKPEGIFLVGITRLVLNGTFSFAATNTWYDLPWDAAEVDALGTWDKSNPTIVVVPPGVSRVRITRNLAWAFNNTGNRYNINHILDSAGALQYSDGLDIRLAANESCNTTVSRRLPVAPGWKLRAQVNEGAGTAPLQGSGFGGPSAIEYEWFR